MAAELGDMFGMRSKPKIAKSITELIDNTPLLELDKSVEGIDASAHGSPVLGVDQGEEAGSEGLVGGDPEVAAVCRVHEGPSAVGLPSDETTECGSVSSAPITSSSITK